jgi:hypothetical protein
MGPKNPSNVLNESPFEGDGRGEEERVQDRTVEALANIRAGSNDK